MSELKIEKTEWEEIEAVIVKRLRNKKKKLDKILQTESKIKNKEITPTKEQKEMITGKSKIEGQILELTEIKNGVRKEWSKVMKKHNKIVKELSQGEEQKVEAVDESLGSVADALLVNLLQNEYDVRNLLGDEERTGLEAIMVPVKNLFTPPADTLIYDRARACFLEIFTNFVKGSEEIIPGSETTYSNLLSSIQGIPESVRTSSHRLDAEDTAADVSPEVPLSMTPEVPQETNEVQVQEEEPAQATAPSPDQDWNQIDNAEEEDDDADLEEDKQEQEEPEEKPKKSKIKKQESINNKKYVDEDGFVFAKPMGKSKIESKSLRGRGRRGGGKDKREAQRQRAKVDRRGGRGGRGDRGGRGYRGRGRGGNQDKSSTDEHSKKSHGKPGHWKKGEVRKVE